MMIKNLSAQGACPLRFAKQGGRGSASGGKKILYFITQSESGGAQRYVFDLANNLKTSFKVAVALGQQADNGKLGKILRDKDIKTFIIPHLKRSISFINDLLAFLEIIKLIKNYQPDVIHLNSSKISILGSIAALFTNSKIQSASWRTKSKIIYTVHGWVFNEPLPLLLKWFYLYAERFTSRFKDKIICVSEYDRQTALKYKIAPENKLVTIHNGLSPINFYSKEEARQRINNAIFEHNSLNCHPGLDPGSKIQRHEQVSGLRVKPAMTNNLLIGSIGNLYKTKGYEYLVKAANILISNFQFPISFIIIGEGKERKHLEDLISKYHLENNFILAGQIDQAARLLPAFTVYVCSSVKEGFPYSVLEARQAGLPIVATEVGGIPEMVENGKSALLVQPANARDLAERIKTLLDNKTLANELGQRAKAGAEFGLKKMVEETKKVYSC